MNSVYAFNVYYIDKQIIWRESQWKILYRTNTPLSSVRRIYFYLTDIDFLPFHISLDNKSGPRISVRLPGPKLVFSMTFCVNTVDIGLSVGVLSNHVEYLICIQD